MKKTNRHKITFQDPSDIEAVAMGQLGMGNWAISQLTGLSTGQIQYRLTKAKRLEGLPTGEGFRSQWRDGTSAIAKEVVSHWAPGLRKQISRTLPGKVEHPTPVIVKEAA